MAIKTITKYLTDDGEEFNYLDSAERHSEDLIRIEHANVCLSAGGSVADALRILGHTSVAPILEEITTDSQLVIEHWQCRDEPGYKPHHFSNKGKLWVYGHAGSWSGPYGNSVPIADLERYAKDIRSIL